MRRTSRKLLAGLVAMLVGGLAACQDAGTPLQPDGLESTDADAAAHGGGPPGHAGGPLADCDVTVPGDAATVQGGVDAAAAGATVCVDGGTWTEQVVIDKDLTLRGLDGATIEGPADPAVFTIPENASNTWEPIVFAHGGTESGGDVSGAGTVDVTVRGFTIDGGGEPGAAGVRYVGILYRNAYGTVEGNAVESMGVGSGETFGILAYGDSEVAIVGNTVSDYERGGIGANGDGGAHPAPQARIVGNDVTGSTGISEAWGPNGIQIGFGASGQIRDNVVRDNRYAEELPTAACIIVFESDDVKVQGNEVENCDAALSVGSWGWFAPSADNVKIQGNRVDEALFGAYVEIGGFPGFTMTDPSVSNVKVVRNRLSGGSIGITGILVNTIDDSDDFDPIADNNKLINNRISDFATAVVDGGTATKRAANAF